MPTPRLFLSVGFALCALSLYATKDESVSLPTSAQTSCESSPDTLAVTATVARTKQVKQQPMPYSSSDTIHWYTQNKRTTHPLKHQASLNPALIESLR